MPYHVKGFLQIYEDTVQILLMLEVLFTQDSEVEYLFSGTSGSGSEPEVPEKRYSTCSSAIISLAWGFSLLKMTFSMNLLK